MNSIGPQLPSPAIAPPMPSHPSPDELRRAAAIVSAELPSTSAWLLAVAARRSAPRRPRIPRVTSHELIQRWQRLHELWGQGKTVYDIASLMGTKVHNVTSWVVQARKHGFCPRRTTKHVPPPPAGTVFPNVTLPIGLPLFGRFRGEFFTAVTLDRRFQVDGEAYDSPSSAAMSAVEKRIGAQRSLNGWDFWKMKLNDGRECLLSNVRMMPDLVNQVRDPSPVSASTLIQLDTETPQAWSAFAASNPLRLTDAHLTQLNNELRLRGEARRPGPDGTTCTVRIVPTTDVA